MSTEYIERGALIKFIEDGLNEKDPQKNFGNDGVRILAEVQFAPAADVEPVVHGEWVRKNNELYCSACGEEALMDEVYYESKRCPECGAHMVVPRADVYGCAENGALLTNVHIGLKTEYETPHECGYCGEHVAKDWSFCPECGRKLHMDERSEHED